MKYEKLLEISMALLPQIEGSCKHTAFLMRRNRIVTVGWPRPFQTHTVCRGQTRFESIHAETAAILNFREFFNAKVKKNAKIPNMDIVSIRLSTDSLVEERPILRNAKPCSACLKLILSLSPIKRLWYTTDEGWKRRNLDWVR